MPGNLAFVEQAVDVGTVDAPGRIADYSFCNFYIPHGIVRAGSAPLAVFPTIHRLPHMNLISGELISRKS